MGLVVEKVVYKVFSETMGQHMSDHKIIPYRRVSTDKQGKSGLGLEAQEDAIRQYASINKCQILRAFTEVESGKKSDRPELTKAFAHARRIGATVVIAKLDRLTRNTRFLLELIEAGADVAFCELPQIPPGPMGKFFLTLMAAVAELEAGLISQRTKAALKAYKARGGKLGAASDQAGRVLRIDPDGTEVRAQARIPDDGGTAGERLCPLQGVPAREGDQEDRRPGRGDPRASSHGYGHPLADRPLPDRRGAHHAARGPVDAMRRQARPRSSPNVTSPLPSRPIGI